MPQETLKIELFGAFKRFGTNGFVDLEVTLPIMIRDLRQVLADHLSETHDGFSREGLYKVSAFATDTAVLPAGAIIDVPTRLAVIPPVSGG
ncbi:hypothetical protein PQU92_14180 [Asticcacaulis sp. BYS171W]|uniref:Molybdopterin synthase sulfur carrier subunit n=1 Tax=Asticcacaulis aquaticus TaxID=2984212 RepID=A0ABT5HWI1_9CAUL|nr:hypothetical protein [Asticcacaulis aquaticus]MDC7684430.1 hypothetical protein [Asticcacaulis aquaticus]